MTCTGTPGYIELQGSTAGTKMQSAMAQVGSTPILALLMAYQPIEATMAAAAEKGTLGAAAATPILRLPFDAAAVINSEEIQWIAVDSNKPVRFTAPRSCLLTPRHSCGDVSADLHMTQTIDFHNNR